MGVSEKRLLMKIFGLQAEEESGGAREKLHHKELHSF
jgi:hypothetical protein